MTHEQIATINILIPTQTKNSKMNIIARNSGGPEPTKIFVSQTSNTIPNIKAMINSDLLAIFRMFISDPNIVIGN